MALDINKERCPRCNGFLYSAEFRYFKFRKSFKGVLHCATCGRDWVVERVNGSYALKPFAVHANPSLRGGVYVKAKA